MILIRFQIFKRFLVIRQDAALPEASFEEEVSGQELDDPFFGLVERGASRDDLWLGRPVPRYTSYPPATAFRDDMTPEAYGSMLEALSAEEPVSLYFHVPFCQALCLYCGCHTMPTRQHERIDAYLSAVHREMEYVAASSERGRRVSQIHFGGGSPNMMSEKDIGLMFGALVRRFDLSSCREIAMELDPRLVTKAQARTLSLTGVNRVSLGVQDFNPDVQEAIGREQPYELVATANDLLRDLGVRNINFDLMYGLPLQSPASVAQTARQAAALKPDRIALFSYAHVPQAKKHQKALEQFILPGPHAALAMERAARMALVEAGYVQIGMDHFALPHDSLAKASESGTLRRNFQGYTDDDSSALLGFGASSIGHLPSAYVQNARDVELYQKRIAEKTFATARGLVLSGEDRVRAAIIESLMCQLSVNIETICREHNYSLSALAAEMEALTPYKKAGLISVESYKIKLATPYRMAVRVIASVFDATKQSADAPVSKAV